MNELDVPGPPPPNFGLSRSQKQRPIAAYPWCIFADSEDGKLGQSTYSSAYAGLATECVICSNGSITGYVGRATSLALKRLGCSRLHGHLLTVAASLTNFVHIN